MYVGNLDNGAIIILSENKEEIEKRLDKFINKKNNEIFVELIQKEGDATESDMGKV